MNKYFVESIIIKLIIWLVFLAISGVTLFGITLLSIEQVTVLIKL